MALIEIKIGFIDLYSRYLFVCQHCAVIVLEKHYKEGVVHHFEINIQPLVIKDKKEIHNSA